MAEVVAIIGLVAAIAQFIEHGSKLIVRLNEFSAINNDQPNVFSTLKIRLTAIISVIKRIQTQIQTRAYSISEPEQEQMLPIIENTIAHIAQLINMFDKIVPPHDKSRMWQKYVRAWKSLATDKAVQRVSGRIQDNIQILSLFQTTSLVESSQKLIYGYGRGNGDISAQVEVAGLSATTGAQSMAAVVVSERQSYGTATAVETVVSISSLETETQVQTNTAEHQTLLDTNSGSSRSSNSTNSEPYTPNTMKATSTNKDIPICRSLCSCICHRPYLLSTPAMLSRIFGRLSIDMPGNGLPMIRCTERQCQRRRDISGNMTYQLPGWMLDRMVRISVKKTALNTHINLNTMRILPDSAEIFSVVSRGDLNRLRNMFATQQASIYDISSGGWTLVHTSFTLNRRDVTQFLIDQGADLTIGAANGSNVMERAWTQAQKSNGPPGQFVVSDSQILREIDLDDFVSQQQYNLVHKAVLGITKLDLGVLLDSSTADIDGVDSRHYTPLWWACVQGNLDAIKTLLDHGASHAVGSRINQLPLHIARNAAVVHLLHQGGAEIDAVDTSGRTALHCYCYRQVGSSDEIVRAILECGANVNARAYGQQTPLHYAVMFDNDALVDPLIEFGADIAATMRGGWTPLLAAIRYDQASCVAKLLEHGADLTCKDGLGQGLLHLAAQHAGVQCMNVLADAATVFTVDVSGDVKDDLDRTAQMYYDMREGRTENLDMAFRHLMTAWRRGQGPDHGNEKEDDDMRYECDCDDEKNRSELQETILVGAYTMPGSFIVNTTWS
ncbi:hypothetical protein PV10_01575 [Exophiala mesophila]|uniref:NACHT-NTPase and P-loop NTPases N-terminal domain-containing protein n=1 Tax=Exophiala mesophila TaxID=212818 RepID=A0A0D1ZV68_EXOME|nr:uncharacterized protein PV10_01575 [Exophiala mesophila]KIV97874.1 hypothetical protein PV10_01575 [Exophiala mesophila]